VEEVQMRYFFVCFQAAMENNVFIYNDLVFVCKAYPSSTQVRKVCRGATGVEDLALSRIVIITIKEWSEDQYSAWIVD
jgi:hypothetical protein